MTGSPIFRTLIAALCLAALSLLLMRLTDSAPANIAGPAAQNELTQTPIPMRVRIRCSHLPTSLTLSSGNQKLADLNAPTELRWEGSVSVPIPPEGLELALIATWADAYPEIRPSRSNWNPTSGTRSRKPRGPTLPIPPI